MTTAALAGSAWKDRDLTLDERMAAADVRVGEIAGVLNSAHGALVDLVADALDGDLWGQWGVHSPSHWLSWKSGIAGRHARHVVVIARRRSELPVTVAGLREGRLSLGQARVIAAHVPAEYEAAAARMAEELTIGQLEATLPQYAFEDPEPAQDHTGQGGDASDDDTGGTGGDHVSGADGHVSGSSGDAQPGPGGGTAGDDEDGGGSESEGNGGSETDGEPGAEGDATGSVTGSGAGSGTGAQTDPGFERRVGGSFGWDDHGFGRLSATLPPDVAIMFETALKAAREAVFRQKSEDLPDGAPRPRVSTVEALGELARSFLATGSTQHPGASRFRIFAHLDTGAEGNRMRSHLGPVLPDRIRRLLTCDSDITPVWETHGTPVSVGRDLRVVTDKMRKLIEHRDGGCAVPGCGRTTVLDVHHIVHWEHGGPTDTANLLTLCRKHHRQHHLGIIGISGNADIRDPDHPDAVRIVDRWGRPLIRAPEPRAPETDEPVQAARDVDLPNDPYPQPTHERLRREDFYLPRTPPRAGPNPEAA